MASTSSPTPSSPASLSTPTSWDVFLSFRGTDTRYSFTSHLYSALDRYNISAFMDDPELQSGEDISAALLQAIQNSKIYIVVFSENYASSSWCLDELVEILNCSKTMQRLVIPVFYNIDPSVVRYQTASFQEDFRRHEIRHDGETERVKNWRLTLRQVADKSGKHIVDGKRSEAEIVNDIVHEILLLLKPTALDVTKYPVGLNSRVKDITSLLSSGTKGVIKIGIYGMGGVGKTTLAKAVFNQLLLGSFKGSCFLANVRETSGTLKGIESLQQQLINDVLRSKNKVEVSSVGEGIKLIEARICSTKILVVIDDLDDHTEFKSLVGPFASGSVVIITTRDEETLDNIEVQSKYRYRVDELGDAESETLLFQHAFGDTKPNNALTILSKDILRLAGGLPLALEVFGSYLYKKSEVRWKSYIETLQRIPNSTIQQRLMISLSALELDDPLLKKMFLDIACFFIGRGKKMVVRILATYYSYADVKIDILIKKCLLTINDYDEVRMHDLLQDVGKEIARNKSPDEPGKHSRLWVPKDIHYVLKEHKGTEAIEGIMLQSFERKGPSKKISVAMETFRRMSTLRYLYLEGTNLTGKFKRTLEDLRWFYWERCPLKCLPFDFCPKKLVILELPRSKMITMWDVNMVSNAFKKLKTLNMSFSQDLATTPDFRRLPSLVNLYLEGCTSLKEVHKSIGSLVSLVTLNLKGCVSLTSLPNTICKLRALEVLCIKECRRLEALPMQLGKIESLKKLNACKTGVQKLPDSIGNLSKLVKLKLDDNKMLEYLPNTICNLRALEVLSISGCDYLEALPDELGKMESLRELNAGWLDMSNLPDSIGDLSKLVELNLNYNEKLEYLPNTICNLRALEVLSIDYCSNVAALPVDLGNIESLRELRAGGTNIAKLPDSICNMRSLEILHINDCDKLERLPDQLWRLTRLSSLGASGTPLNELPDIESSQTSLSLRSLNLFRSEITALPSGISHLSSLEELDLIKCGRLLSIAELPLNLLSIHLNDCTSLGRLNLSKLKLLRVLNLKNCSSLTEILGLGELASLNHLFLRGCQSSLPALILTKSLVQIYSGFEHEIGVLLESKMFPDWIIQSSVEGSADDEDDDNDDDYFIEVISDGSSQSNVDDNDDDDDDGFIEEISDGNSQDESDLADDISDGNSQDDDSDSADEISDGRSQDDSDLAEKILEVSSSVNLQPDLSHNYLGMILCFEMRGDIYPPYYSVMTPANNISGSGYHMEIYGSCIVIVPRSIFSITEADHTVRFTSNARRHWIHLLYKDEDDSTTVETTSPPVI